MKRLTLDEIFSRLDSPEVIEKKEKLAEFVGLDLDLMEGTLFSLVADLMPMSETSAAKLRGRANYDLCKFAARQGSLLGQRASREKPKESPAAKAVWPEEWTAAWRGNVSSSRTNGAEDDRVQRKTRGSGR